MVQADLERMPAAPEIPEPRPPRRGGARVLPQAVRAAIEFLTPAGAMFLALGVLVGALYVGAQLTVPGDPKDGITRIRWSTDEAPARPMQTGRFHECFPDCQAIVDPGLGADQTKLIVQCATGVGPDVIDIYDTPSLHQLVGAGILLDLTPYAQKMGFGPDKTYPALRDGLMVDGRQYRYPCNVWANVMVYNKTIFDDHHIPYPKDDWTWDEFIQMGLKLRDKSTSRTGTSHIPLASYHRWNMFHDVLFSFGGRRFAPDGLTSALDSPEALGAWRLYAEFFTKYHIIPSQAEADAMSAQGGWGLSPLRWFADEKAAMIPIGRWYIIQARIYPGLLEKLGVARLPHVPGRPSCGAIDARGAGINAKAPPQRRQAALKFLQYLASEPYNRLIVEDGDALPPNPAMAREGKDLVNAAIADPAWHQKFVDAARDARPVDVSPFIDSGLVQRMLGEVLEKVENGTLTAEQGAAAFSNETNQIIRTNLARQPNLRRKFQQVTGRPYTPDWWKNRPTGLSVVQSAGQPAD